MIKFRFFHVCQYCHKIVMWFYMRASHRLCSDVYILCDHSIHRTLHEMEFFFWVNSSIFLHRFYLQDSYLILHFQSVVFLDNSWRLLHIKGDPRTGRVLRDNNSNILILQIQKLKFWVLNDLSKTTEKLRDKPGWNPSDQTPGKMVMFPDHSVYNIKIRANEK